MKKCNGRKKHRWTKEVNLNFLVCWFCNQTKSVPDPKP